MLHLGALDESLIRLNDLYICIKPIKKSSTELLVPSLCAVWRSFVDGKIIYHPLDPDKESLSPLGIEMLADDIPQLLQSLLVGVERTVCRVSLDEFIFPTSIDSGNDSSSSEMTTNNDNDECKQKINNIESPLKRTIECSLKRSKIISNKYTLKRLTNKSEIDKNLLIKSEQGNGQQGDIAIGSTEATTATTTAASTVVIANNSDTNSMPLFCLGGSFPHIDSDEESGDDMKRSETGKI